DRRDPYVGAAKGIGARYTICRAGALSLRGSGWAILAGGELEILRRVSGETISRIEKEGLLPHVDPRALAAAGAKGIKGGGMDEGTGVSKAGQERWSGIRLCNLVA